MSSPSVGPVALGRGDAKTPPRVTSLQGAPSGPHLSSRRLLNFDFHPGEVSSTTLKVPSRPLAGHNLPTTPEEYPDHAFDIVRSGKIVHDRLVVQVGYNLFEDRALYVPHNPTLPFGPAVRPTPSFGSMCRVVDQPDVERITPVLTPEDIDYNLLVKPL